MDLWDAQKVITESSSDQWELWGPEEEASFEVHAMSATFRPDVLFVLRWGRVEGDDLDEPWLKKFPSGDRIRWYSVDATYGGSMVLRESFVAVEGGRYHLPLPSFRNDKYQVTKQQVVLARLMQGLHRWVGHETADQGIEIAGFVTVE